MTRLIVVVEELADWAAYYPSADVVVASHYLRLVPTPHAEKTQVINLCRSYAYLTIGYYVSLLAEARQHSVMPSVRTINDLAQEEEIGELVFFKEAAPLVRGKSLTTLTSLSEEEGTLFAQAIDSFSSKLWLTKRAKKQYKYDMAILYSPEEKIPPSSKQALSLFIAAGKKLGIKVQLILPSDIQKLPEYDALFIRETTSLSSHTYQFACLAEKENLVVIDDPTSILRCTNKIYLHDLLTSRKIPTPITEVIYEGDSLDTLSERIPFPIVLKVPDGSFSIGVIKVSDQKELEEGATQLFQASSLLIAQEYLYTEVDWRVGVLNNSAIYACKYFMSKGHWQIYNHAQKQGNICGPFEAVSLQEVPPDVLKLALRATARIGNGLYGVDLKHVNGRAVIIEVNDNPSIDAGVEDSYLGKSLYLTIMREFLRRMDEKRQ